MDNNTLEMKKEDLSYNKIKGIFERLFIAPITKAATIDEDDYIKYSSLNEEQVKTMEEFALRCKKYEDAYNNSSSKYRWELNHARQYRELREEFSKLVDNLFKKNKNKKHTSRNEVSLEDITRTFQEEHARSLKSSSIKKTSCKWIQPGEIIEVNGITLTKGCFYVGDYFKIPSTFRDIRTYDRNHREVWSHNRRYNLFRIYGPVIQPGLPISPGELIVVPFSSYLDMHPTHRYEYLEWLAGERKISEITADTFLFYLSGLQIKMFIDFPTKKEERLTIVKHSIDLFLQSQKEDVYYVELEQFIDASISKYFLDNIVELVPNDLLKQLKLCREALIVKAINNTIENDSYKIIENICRSLIVILNSDNFIPKNLLTDDFYSQFAIMVKAEISTRHYDGAWCKLMEKDLNLYENYCFISNKDFSMLRSDYIFLFHLFLTYYDMGFLNQCINVCFNRLVKQITGKKA